MTRLPAMAMSLFLALAADATAQDKQDKSAPISRDNVSMSKEFLNALAGSWEGSCRTWFEPGKLSDESEVRGEIRPVLDGLAIRHEYEASIQGRPRRGEETIAFNAVTNKYQISWVDDFHMNYAILFSEGGPIEGGFSVSGKYDVGPGIPRWGWRTVFELIDDEHLTITAYNITPEGQEAKAVETKYRRVEP